MSSSFLKDAGDYLPAYSPNTQPTGILENAAVASAPAFFTAPAIFDYNLDKRVAERDNLIKNNFKEIDYIGSAKTEAEEYFGKPETLQDIENKKANLQSEYEKSLDAQIISGRQSEPDKWAGISTTEEIKQYYNQEINSGRQVASDYASRGAGVTSQYVAPFVGSVAGSMLDPINVATLPLGMSASTSIIKTIAGEAAINMGIELTQLPEYQRVETALGTPMSASDMALQVATAGLGAGAITGVSKGLPPAYNFIKNRGKRIEVMDRIAESPLASKAQKYAAKWTGRKAKVEDNVPQEIIDAVQSNNPNIIPETAVNKAVQIHRKNLEETLAAIEAGRQPDYQSIPKYDVNDDVLAPQPTNIKVDNAEKISRTTLGIEQAIPKAESMIADWKVNKTKVQNTWQQKIGYNPKELHVALKERGGIMDSGGELKSRDVTPKTFIGGVRTEYKGNRSKGYTESIDRKTGFAVRSMEALQADGNFGVLEWAKNEGYFPQGSEPTMSDLYDLIAKSVHEGGVYRQSDVDDMRNWEQNNDGTAKSNPYGITNKTTPYELAQKLYHEKLDIRDQKRNLMHNNIYEKLMATGRDDLPLWEYQDLIMTSYDSLINRYGDIDDAFEAEIEKFFDGLRINETMQNSADDNTFFQATRANLGLSGDFNEADYRPSVINWAKNKFGERTAPDGSLAWQNFTQWFGDSKVVNDAGEPLVVYHGTGADFEAFDISKAGTQTDDGMWGQGFYFAKNKKMSQAYGSKILKNYLKIENPFIVKNTSQIDAKYKIKQFFNKDDAKNLTKVFLDDGYDGVIHYEKKAKNPLVQYIAFSPNQIKSVNNKGAFSPDDNRTLYQKNKNSDNFTPSLEGFEPISQRELIERKMQGGSKAKVAQKGMTGETNLFDQSELKQDTLFQRVWHGSPYRNIEKTGFKLDKIGTGEGVQAYGWGLYFTKTKEIAESYRKNLSEEDIRINGEQFKPNNYTITQIVTLNKNNKAKMREELQAYIDKYAPENNPRGNENPYAHREDAVRLIAALDSNLLEVPENIGQLYEAEIPEDDVMLLWDKPFSEQPEAVKKALKENLQKSGDYADSINAGFFYKNELKGFVADNLGIERTAEAASKWLNSIGIKGIKYLDGTSRKQGEGSYNYVVFDDTAIEIIDTYYQEAKGSITFQGNQSFIELGRTADASTFIHEMGHFYTNMLRQLSKHEKAPAELIADYHAMEDFVGAERGQKFTVEQEEKLARGFEQYFREGIAPNEQLKGLFATMKDWLMQIYQSWRDLDVELTDSIRRVFDRLLTADVTRQYTSKNDSYDAMMAAKLSDDQTLFSTTQTPKDLFYEAGDFYVSTMREAILQPSTSVKAIKDYQAIIDFVGGDMRTPLNIAQKQQIADAVETHFMTGNPPSEELREIFANMRKLASSKYEELWNSDVYIPDEIVAVMDKWRQPAMIEPNDFVTNSVNDKLIPPQLEFEQSEIDFAQQADFARLVRDFGDEIDDVTGLSYKDINAMIEADNNVIAAMQTCAR